MSNQPPVWAQVHRVDPDGTTNFLDDVNIQGLLRETGPTPWVDVTHPDFDADPLGINDSLAAFNAAAQSLPTISGSRTGTILVPPGTYRLSDTFNQPSHVVVKGYGLGTRFYPTAVFPALTPLWRLGDSQQAIATGCRLEDVWIDCQGAADGVVTNQTQELSGLRNVTITGYTRYGIHYQNGAIHCDFSDIWLYCHAAAVGSIGFYGDLFGGSFSIRNLTVDTAGGAGTQEAGIYLVGVSAINGGHVLLERIHVEEQLHGIYFGVNAFGTAGAVNGEPGVTNLVTIASGAGPVTLTGIQGGGSTHTINDLQQVIVCDAQIVPLWISTYPGGSVSWATTLGGRVLTPSLFVPAVAAGANAGTLPPAPILIPNSQDQRGTITWGSGTSASPGTQVAVTFAAPNFRSGLTVQLTAINPATATLLPFAANATDAGFEIATVGDPTDSQANTVYGCYYSVQAAS